MRKMNVCGVPEEEFRDGKCNKCGRSVCDMSPDRLIDERLYNYARKHLLMPSGMFVDHTFVFLVKERGLLAKAPKYVQKFVEEAEKRECKESTTPD